MQVKIIIKILVAVTIVLNVVMNSYPVKAQAPHLNSDVESYHLFDRINVLYGSNSILHSNNRNLDRRSIIDFYKQIYFDVPNGTDKMNIEKFVINNQEYIVLENDKDVAVNNYVDSSNLFYTIEKRENGNVFNRKSSKPILKYFYKSPGKFYELNKEHFSLTINPILNVKIGKENDTDSPVFQNLRGVEISGLIDDKVYFYTNILENQQLFNNYTEAWIANYDAIPGAGFYKSYNSNVLDELRGWDFLNSQAYVGVKLSRSINIEFGHGKHFIGNGVRSLLLSDYSNNYFYLKFNTKIWKFEYQNIFAELSSLSSRQIIGDKLIPKKYFAAHYLSYKASSNFEIGLFETIVFSRENHFEFQYLNPIILYRTAEHLVGSPDNILIGLNVNWNLLRRVSLYGQLILDEFKIGELFNNSGWWANKYGVQLGLKYFNILGVDQLDGQIEYNIVRPYTYSHSKTVEGYDQSIASYSNYNQPLAHPRGANFKELLVNLKYRALSNLMLKSSFMHTIYGADIDGMNWGVNILKLNGNRVEDYGNEIGQGDLTEVNQISFEANYEVFQNYFLDFHYIYRTQKGQEVSSYINTNYFGGGVRVNISQLNYNY